MSNCEKTREELLREIHHLTHMNGNLAAENARLRGAAERVPLLEQSNTELRHLLKEEQEEVGAYKDEEADLLMQIEDLETKLEAYDPDAICEYVHDFLRLEHLLPESLDAPIFLAPHSYVIGLYEAVQKVLIQ